MGKKVYGGKTRYKKYENLDFSDDFMFCKILQTKTSLTKELLELILDEKISALTGATSQKSVNYTPEGRGVRFDVYLEDGKKTVYDIEMQTTKEKHIGKRTRYYQGMLDLSMLEHGDGFEKLKKSIIIFICTKKPAGFAADLPVYTFRTKCEENADVNIGDDMVKIVLNASYSFKNATKAQTVAVSEGLKNFLSYIRDKRPLDDFTKRLQQEVLSARLAKKWRKEYMTYLHKLEEEYNKGFQKGYNSSRDQYLKSAIVSAYNQGVSMTTAAKIIGLKYNEAVRLAHKYGVYLDCMPKVKDKK